MKKNLFALILILIFVGLFAQEPADNIQGKVYIWSDSQQEYIPVGPYQNVTVTLYYDNGTVFETATVQTNQSSFYSHNFYDQYNNSSYCDEVKVIFRSVSITESYDGIVSIDIYYDLEQPVPDPEPNND